MPAMTEVVVAGTSLPGGHVARVLQTRIGLTLAVMMVAGSVGTGPDRSAPGSSPSANTG